MLQIRNTNLVLLYWSRLYRSVLLGKYVNIFTTMLGLLEELVYVKKAILLNYF